MTGGAVRCPASHWTSSRQPGLVHHYGPHYAVGGIQFLPRPVRRPGVPVWAAGFPGNVKLLHRAARVLRDGPAAP